MRASMRSLSNYNTLDQGAKAHTWGDPFDKGDDCPAVWDGVTGSTGLDSPDYNCTSHYLMTDLILDDELLHEQLLRSVRFR